MGDKDDNISIIETRKSKPLKNIKFAFEVNEMAWDLSGKQVFLTTGGGTVEVFSYEQMLKPGPAESARTLHAHTANCYCIEFSPSGEYFAVGGADALVSLWHLQELVCMRTFGRLEWPVRTVSFSHDSAFIASGSEDPQVDIADVETSRQVHSIPCSAPMNSVSWHPTRHLLAYAGDDKNKSGQDEGSLRVFGFS